VITYSATLDVPRPLAQYLARLLHTGRRERGTRRGRRALTPFRQAVLVLRWFRQDTALTALARDAGISIATSYRYLHEGIDVLAAQAPELPEILRARLAAGDTHVILDGTLIPSDRVAETTVGTRGTPIHLWYSGKHRRFGANVQFVATADGFPLWVSDALPGNTHDLAAAREHRVTGALYAAAAQGLAALADKGYQGHRHRYSHPDEGSCRRQRPRRRHRLPQHVAVRTSVSRRTGRRVAHHPLEGARQDQPVPQTNRIHRQSSARTHPVRACRPLLRKPHWREVCGWDEESKTGVECRQRLNSRPMRRWRTRAPCRCVASLPKSMSHLASFLKQVSAAASWRKAAKCSP